MNSFLTVVLNGRFTSVMLIIHNLKKVVKPCFEFFVNMTFTPHTVKGGVGLKKSMSTFRTIRLRGVVMGF